MQPFYIHRQSAYLIGRDRKIADFPVDHPSCSKQHAVLQYRSMPFERNGAVGRRTLPYIIDLGSANGTYLNSERIEPQRYYELKEQDILK
jgi:smad nuclear-interacting protein 1